MGSIYRQKGRSIWRLKYYRNGQAISESSGTSVKDDARTLLRKREGALADGRTVSARSQQLLFDAAMADVLNDLPRERQALARQRAAAVRSASRALLRQAAHGDDHHEPSPRLHR